MGQDHLSESKMSITAEDLKGIVAAAVATAIQEARKPAPPTEQELASKEMAQQFRKAAAADVMATAANKKNFQRICVHEHAKREGGGTHCVWVREEDPTSPGYIYCQKCEGKVRPEGGNQGTKREDRTAIYDTALFNKLFQDCNESALMG